MHIYKLCIKKKRGKLGFTLIEVIIASTMFFFIALSTFWITSAMLKYNKDILDRTKKLRNTLFATEVIESDFRSASRLYHSLSGGGNKWYNNGDIYLESYDPSPRWVYYLFDKDGRKIVRNGVPLIEVDPSPQGTKYNIDARYFFKGDILHGTNNTRPVDIVSFKISDGTRERVYYLNDSPNTVGRVAVLFYADSYPFVASASRVVLPSWKAPKLVGSEYDKPMEPGTNRSYAGIPHRTDTVLTVSVIGNLIPGQTVTVKVSLKDRLNNPVVSEPGILVLPWKRSPIGFFTDENGEFVYQEQYNEEVSIQPGSFVEVKAIYYGSKNYNDAEGECEVFHP